MIAFPIYRPEVTAYHRYPDGVWDTTRYGTNTMTLFEPMADEAGNEDIGPGLRRVVKFGTEPFFVVLAPEGSELVKKGRACYLRTPDGKHHDAVNTLIMAKRQDSGFDLDRPSRPAVMKPPASAIDPAPSRPRGPVVQMALFA